MKPIYITLVFEDELSECVLEKIIGKRAGYEISSRIGKRGNQYLKNMVKNLNIAAAAQPVLLLTDLDMSSCPPELIEQWLGREKHPQFLFRVAVREVESWVLASSEKFKNFFGLHGANIPNDCDSIAKPKEFLIEIARRIRKKSLRDEIVPKEGSTAKKGYGYNARLCEFISEHWDEKEAVLHSESLRRCVKAIENLSNTERRLKFSDKSNP